MSNHRTHEDMNRRLTYHPPTRLTQSLFNIAARRIYDVNDAIFMTLTTADEDRDEVCRLLEQLRMAWNKAIVMQHRQDPEVVYPPLTEPSKD